MTPEQILKKMDQLQRSHQELQEQLDAALAARPQAGAHLNDANNTGWQTMNGFDTRSVHWVNTRPGGY